MMLMENTNSDVRLLVLVRPADSLCALLQSLLQETGAAYTVYSTVYELINGIHAISADQPLVLIVRPAMLGRQAASFLQRYFPRLRIIGWIDAGEHVSDTAIAHTVANGMVTAGHLEQLRRMVHMMSEPASPNPSVSETPRASAPDTSKELEYDLSDEEVKALLGVE